MADKQIELAVGRKYSRLIGPAQVITIEIERLDVPKRLVAFKVVGKGVENPEKQRVLDMGALALWLESMPTVRPVKTEEQPVSG